ncbi:hypothetical protein ACFL27_12280 [candidate division CSSED10-310 bacterium]|uniref:Uncharacterized protein n=1 Tax=candidate division CSSED10-310 bacterium TaxID=2855610 RepID=A0ABV6YXP6_UNCC1
MKEKVEKPKKMWTKTEPKEKIQLKIKPKKASITIPERDTEEKEKESYGFVTNLYRETPKNERDIIIGFDFGTSCTKVVIRDDVINVSYAVPFEFTTCAKIPFLLPTCIRVDDHGSLSLTSGKHIFEDLKIKLIENSKKKLLKSDDATVSAFDLAVGYIALVLREVRKWFWLNHSDTYRNDRLNWQVNIGMPARSFDDKKLEMIFRTIALAGWNLSVNKADLNIDLIHQAIKKSQRQLKSTSQKISQKKYDIHPDYVIAIPEIIAEVIGYANSPLKKPGLHFLVDVGASTLDTSTFILNEKDYDKHYYLLTAEVDRYGSYSLHYHRLLLLSKILEKHLADWTIVNDGLSPIPDVQDFFSEMNAKKVDLDSDFKIDCKKLVNKVILVTKNNRDPHSEVWQKGLPVFLCGGGAKIDFYKKVITASANELGKNFNIAPYKILELPLPANLKAPGLSRHDYNRLAVAYGLSFSKDSIGEIKPPRKIEDLVPDRQVKDYKASYVSKDMV